MASPILLDTDVLIDFLRGNEKADVFINTYNAHIILSSIVVAELKTLNIRHYPMLKDLKPAYLK